MSSGRWRNLPLRRLGVLVGGGTPPSDPEYWDGEIPFVTPPDLRSVVGRRVTATERTLTPAGLARGSALAPAGAVILSIRAPIGYVARAPRPVAFNQGCRALVPSEQADARFLVYALMAAAAELDSRGRGTTFMELSATQMAAVEVPAPPLDEQRAIADYLDRETAQIDDLIAKQEMLFERLGERTNALRASAFADVPGSRRTTVRRVLEPLRRNPLPGLGVVTAYRDGQVTLRSKRRDDGYTLSFTESGYQEVQPGDLVFHALDGFAGAVGISDSRGNCTPVYHVCRALGDNDPTYLAEYLRFLGTSGFLALQAPNVRERSVDFRNWSTFARVPLSLPCPDDQRRIVGRLATADRQANALQKRARRFIALAQERRAALITAAVTGQLDVRTAA